MKDPVRRPACDERSCPNARGGFLMQRILARGQLHRRPERVFLCPDQLPCDAQPPFSVLDAAVCGQPQWRDAPCAQWSGIPLSVLIPVHARLRDARGREFSVELSLEAALILRSCCPDHDLWRGRIFVQAAVRPWDRCLPRQGDGHEIALELCVEGYLLVACATAGPCQPSCMDPRPLYPRLDGCCFPAARWREARDACRFPE